MHRQVQGTHAGGHVLRDQCRITFQEPSYLIDVAAHCRPEKARRETLSHRRRWVEHVHRGLPSSPDGQADLGPRLRLPCWRLPIVLPAQYTDLHSLVEAQPGADRALQARHVVPAGARKTALRIYIAARSELQALARRV
jgi:hypothetical protein